MGQAGLGPNALRHGARREEEKNGEFKRALVESERLQRKKVGQVLRSSFQQKQARVRRHTLRCFCLRLSLTGPSEAVSVVRCVRGATGRNRADLELRSCAAGRRWFGACCQAAQTHTLANRGYFPYSLVRPARVRAAAGFWQT